MGQLRACESPRAMSSSTAHATTPTPQNGTVPPRQVLGGQRRPQEYLTPKEVGRLIAAAWQNRYGHSDAAMILVADRHGLRVAELCTLAGIRSTSSMGFCTSGGSRTACPASTRSEAGNHQFSFWVFGMRRCGLARVGEIEALLSRAGAVEA